MEVKEAFYIEVKPLLFALAYQMLGKASEAEDIVQDAFLKLSMMEEQEIHNVKAYLCKMVTNKCLDALKSARYNNEVYIGPNLPEPIAVTDESHPYYKIVEDENLSLAYLRIMKSLKPKERAVFLLREGMNLEYKWIANILNTSEENCRKLLSRGKQKIAKQENDIPFTVQDNKDVILQFITAFQSGNIENMLQLISEDVILYSDGGGKVIAATKPIVSHKNVVAFLTGIYKRRPENHQLQIQKINGQLGIINQFGDDIHSTVSFHISNNKIQEIYYIVNPDKLNNLFMEL